MGLKYGQWCLALCEGAADNSCKRVRVPESPVAACVGCSTHGKGMQKFAFLRSWATYTTATELYGVFTFIHKSSGRAATVCTRWEPLHTMSTI